jgi:hypothetical protein
MKALISTRILYYNGTNVEKDTSKNSLKRLNLFIREIKSRGFKYTNTFIGNLIEKTS